MSPEEAARLLAYARSCIAAAVRDLPPPGFDSPSAAHTRQGAAFVTIRSRGDLRGCIGHVVAQGALWESVREMAVAAASRDTRFEPLGPEEPIEIEISVLSPMRPIRPEEIVVGLHGLYVKLNGSSGLLLPQVAVEWGWDRYRFLEQTCKKAGLPLDAWRDPALQVLGFTAEILK